MPHRVKRGDGKVLRWELGRDLTDVTTARVIISRRPDTTPAVDRDGVIEDPRSDGIVSLELGEDDYAAGKLEEYVAYRVEVETLPGPLTHPDTGYEWLTVEPDLG